MAHESYIDRHRKDMPDFDIKTRVGCAAMWIWTMTQVCGAGSMLLRLPIASDCFRLLPSASCCS